MVYHVYNKSIADYTIFNNDYEFYRMLLTIRYYQVRGQAINLSRYIEQEKYSENQVLYSKLIMPLKDRLVDIIAYCLMPTHIHLILQETQDNGIPIFMSIIQNSYARCFNIKHNRKGPLWEGQYKKVLVENDNQLLHLTRYIHLNPVTAYIVNKPDDYLYSSYKEYLNMINMNEKICTYDKLLNVIPDIYRKFVEDNISYQRDLAKNRTSTI